MTRAKKTEKTQQITLEQLEKIQLSGLKWSVKHAFENSRFYREKFGSAGVKPADIKTLKDITRLPFTTADDLKTDYPFPLLSVPHDRVIRIHSSSGTTGKRKILTYTRKDISDWTEFFARCYRMAGVGPGSRVQIAVGYGLWTAGAGFQAACEEAGAMAVPVGPGNIDMQCQFLEDLQPDVLCCTASMALLLSEEIKRRNMRDRINLKTIIQGSERCSDAMRQAILENSGAEHLYDITGMTELYGPGTGIDCHLHQGIHYWSDFFIFEFLDPDTLEPVKEGEIGEIVVTTLKKEASPLIRYRTRDLTRVISGPCECGSPYPRHDRILGRSDDMIIFRGVNIYPGQIDEILSETAQNYPISSEFDITLKQADGRDTMLIRVEREPDGDPDQDQEIEAHICSALRSRLIVSPEISIVDYGALPRSERKSKRIYDNRQSAL
jgi:phenylacetate-CoA ligase